MKSMNIHLEDSEPKLYVDENSAHLHPTLTRHDNFFLGVDAEESDLKYAHQRYSDLRGVGTKVYTAMCISPRSHMVFTPLLTLANVGTLEFRSVAEHVGRILMQKHVLPSSFLRNSAIGLFMFCNTGNEIDNLLWSQKEQELASCHGVGCLSQSGFLPHVVVQSGFSCQWTPKGIRRVFFRTSSTEQGLMYKKDFDSRYVGFMEDGAKWLVENTDIKFVGTDYFAALDATRSEVYHAYQLLMEGGLKDENIIVFMYDDIANNEENPTPDVIINSPQRDDVSTGVPKDYISDYKIASDSHIFLLKWFERYPDFQSNPLYIPGDSYAGVYVPTLPYEVMKGIEAGVKPILNFKGYLVGNGVTDNEFDGNALVSFAHGTGLMSNDFFVKVMKACNGNFTNTNDQTCSTKLEKVDEVLNGLNIHNTLEPCYYGTDAWSHALALDETCKLTRDNYDVFVNVWDGTWMFYPNI